MKLNIGSSNAKDQYKNKEWINLEYCKDFAKNAKSGFVIGSGCELPFKDDSFELIHCVHVLEHVERKDHSKFLSEMYRTLIPGGEAFVEVPNFFQIVQNILNSADKERIRCWTLSVYGKGRYNGDIHRWGFYPILLKEDMEAVGFKVEIPKEHISNHYKQEPVILMKGIK